MDTHSLWSIIYVLTAWIIVDLVRPFLRSYGAESGKNAATKDDIAEITRKVEEVKAAVSDDLWTKQAAWTMKRDSYIALIDALADYEFAVSDAREGEVYRYDPVEGRRPKPGKEDEAKALEGGMNSAWRELHRRMTVATFVFDDRTAQVVLDNPLFSADENEGLDSEQFDLAVARLRTDLKVEAQRELSLRVGPESN